MTVETKFRTTGRHLRYHSATSTVYTNTRIHTDTTCYSGRGAWQQLSGPSRRFERLSRFHFVTDRWYGYGGQNRHRSSQDATSLGERGAGGALKSFLAANGDTRTYLERYLLVLFNYVKATYFRLVHLDQRRYLDERFVLLDQTMVRRLQDALCNETG